MSTRVANLIKRASMGKPKQYNILTFPTHERYESQLAKTGHNFYAFTVEGMKKWDTNYAPIPENYYTMPEGSIYQGIHFHFILSQSKFGQIQVANQINQRLELPILSLEHTLPIPSWPEGQREALSSMQGDYNVFISEYSRDEWGADFPNCRVVHHGVDTDVFREIPEKKEDKSGLILSVVNDFVNRDYCCNFSGWQRITNGLPVRLVGATEGLSEPAKSVEDLVNEYNSCQVFLNTSTVSPVPTTLLEAMSCGCAVVSTATCMIPHIIEHGVNGLVSNDENELRGYVEAVLKDDELRQQLGNNARKTVESRFSTDKFVGNWNKLFDEVAE